mmetsp:Transcript_63004/g.153434  ORF Transcript_63004/g.153434 Transcript_63004/m.153434 type:complete len:95 (-) Transcript_63004:99-383(-)
MRWYPSAGRQWQNAAIFADGTFVPPVQELSHVATQNTDGLFLSFFIILGGSKKGNIRFCLLLLINGRPFLFECKKSTQPPPTRVSIFRNTTTPE